MSETGGERQSAAARRRRRRRRGGSGAGRDATAAAQSAAAQSAVAQSAAAQSAGSTSQGPQSGGLQSQGPDGGRTKSGGGGTTKSTTGAGRTKSGGTKNGNGARRVAASSAAASSNSRSSKRSPGRDLGTGGRPARTTAQVPRHARPRPVAAGSGYPGAHELADAQNEERRRANTRRLRLIAALAGATPAIVLGVVVGLAAGPIAGAVVAVAAFVVVTLLVTTRSMALALRLVGGVPVGQGVLPALANQVEGLCATLGVAQPELRLLDEPVANACALAGRGRAVLVVTTGLLERLGLIEMEGVVAHELVHLRRRDASVSSVAVATAGVVAWVTGRDSLVHLAVGRGREFGADQAAALAVRYPPGLHDALESLGGRPSGPGSPFSGRRWAATRWIWTDPDLGASERAPLGEIDATAVRVEALAEL